MFSKYSLSLADDFKVVVANDTSISRMYQKIPNSPFICWIHPLESNHLEMKHHLIMRWCLFSWLKTVWVCSHYFCLSEELSSTCRFLRTNVYRHHWLSQLHLIWPFTVYWMNGQHCCVHPISQCSWCLMISCTLHPLANASLLSLMFLTFLKRSSETVYATKISYKATHHTVAEEREEFIWRASILLPIQSVLARTWNTGKSCEAYSNNIAGLVAEVREHSTCKIF